jgi:hypothetical protein
VPRVYDVIAKIAGELGKVGLSKDKTNQQQGFKYRGVDDAMNALNPLLAKHGLLILPRVTKYQCVERVSASGKPLFYTILDVEYDFISSEDGSKHTVGPMIGEAMDSGDKSANKAMAIAYKYVCFQAFCIPTEATVDPDAEVHNVLTPAQALGKRFVTALPGSCSRRTSTPRSMPVSSALRRDGRRPRNGTPIPQARFDGLRTCRRTEPYALAQVQGR